MAGVTGVITNKLLLAINIEFPIARSLPALTFKVKEVKANLELVVMADNIQPL